VISYRKEDTLSTAPHFLKTDLFRFGHTAVDGFFLIGDLLAGPPQAMVP